MGGCIKKKEGKEERRDPFLQSHLAAGTLSWLCSIGAESRTASIDNIFASPAFVEAAVLQLRSNMISARWNLAVGPVILVVGAYGAVLAATLATEFSGNKQEKVSETKTKA